MDFSWRWLCAGLAGLFVLTGSASGDEFGPRPLDIYHVSVTPDGSKFHVQIGPDGPRREFASR